MVQISHKKEYWEISGIYIFLTRILMQPVLSKERQDIMKCVDYLTAGPVADRHWISWPVIVPMIV
jgi:hypothetical protein